LKGDAEVDAIKDNIAVERAKHLAENIINKKELRSGNLKAKDRWKAKACKECDEDLIVNERTQTNVCTAQRSRRWRRRG
jgi:hypothetical protein